MSAPQPITQAYQPGRPVVAIIRDAPNKVVWNTVTLAWETYNASNLAQYEISLTDPDGVGWYTADFPTPLLGMTVQIVTYDTANMTNPIGAVEMNPPDTSAAATTPTSPAIVEIVNKAFDFLGVGLIASLDEDSEAANRAKAVYAGILDATLRSHFWKFATYIDTLPLLSLPDFSAGAPGFPVPGWEFMYGYPPQCLMIRKIFDNTFCDPSIKGVGFVGYTWDYDFMSYYDLYKDILFRFQVMQTPSSFVKAIAAHVNPAYIEYTYRVTDPGMWDQWFSDAMSWNIAARLAHRLTGNMELAKQASGYFAGVVSEAKRLDAQEDRTHHSRMSSYQRARM
jgi:hypothetical protein